MAGRHLRRSRHGAALLLFLVILVGGTLGVVVGSLSPALLDAWRARQTHLALAEARTALLWYAANFREQQNRIQVQAGNPPPNFVPGYLPLPDLGTGNNTNIGCPWEGCDANLSGAALNKTVIGRLPWFVLGTGPLRDGNGECLWYAVSGGHQRVDKAVPMNWDTLGQIDIVTTSETDPAKLRILLASPHERPTAIIFSPGPPLGGQNRADLGGNDVRVCGGNYDPANYLEPSLVTALLDSANNPTGASAYYAGHVSTDTATTRLAIAAQGKIHRDGIALKQACPTPGAACALVANDLGLPLAPDTLFGAIRKNALFRQDINSLLDRVVGCLRDEIAAGGGPSGYNRIAGAINHACYGQAVPPINYYPHYQELLFVARAAAIVNGIGACNGALLFASQRGAGQVRETPADRNNWANYLEDVNFTNFAPAGAQFSGPELFERASPEQPVERDIVRCIPDTPSFVAVGPAVAGLGPLAAYLPGSRTLTLGQPVAATLPASAAGSLFGCAWMPETRPMGAGLRSYFMFRINDAGFSPAPAEGIAFAIVDGDNNGADACGAAGQHLGYSGNNALTPFIAPPKIAFEIDPRRNADFNPNLPNTLFNGRNDPPTIATTYRGGHVAIVYWGGDAPIPTTATPPCAAPRFESGGFCHLPQEEDDNVHGPRGNVRPDYPVPPANPSVPGLPLSVPPDAPAGVYKLDPQRSRVPVHRNFHVRLELTRARADTVVTTARVATTGAIVTTAPGNAIDGVILFPNDRVLVKDQVIASENGIYVWNGATRPLSRAEDADSSQELSGSVVEVTQGTANARSLWRQTAPAPTPGADAIQWNNLRVKVAIPSSNINLDAPGAQVDGILMKPGDRVLVLNLGIYLWNGATAAMTVAPDNFTGAVVQVQQGGAASGLWRFDGSDWSRQSARVATQSDLAIAAPANPVDGVTLASGDLVLVKAQKLAGENGLYVWHGEGIPMTSHPWPAGGLLQVLQGTDAGRAFRQTGPATWSAIDGSPRYTLEIWILPDSVTTANQIAAMQDTTRPMSFLADGFIPHLRDAPIIPYPFRNVRLGFTVGQRPTPTDQHFTVTNAFTTWIP
ncbi:MAG: hypothetical protein KGZ43_02160 [Sulfuritalea sp.]|nr:hypothetical protein [Sulfuritalea sp.]